MTEEPTGFDLGNGYAKLYLLDKSAKIPSRCAFQQPPGAISPKTGLEMKSISFQLIFKDKPLWFGQDALGVGAIQKLGMSKYQAEHISVLFLAALYQWGKAHKQPLEDLGKLNVVCSMPPGMYQKPAMNKIAMAAFRNAFNRGQSHAKIRDTRETVQVVTQFGGLVPEAVEGGKSVPCQGEMVLTVDLGAGTNDYVIFNGSPEPLKTLTQKAGLLHAFTAMGGDTDPAMAELKVLRNKKGTLPPEIRVYYNEVERRIQLLTDTVGPIDRLYIIGGGAALMPPGIQSNFDLLADKVIFKNEYANAKANWRSAGGGG